MNAKRFVTTCVVATAIVVWAVPSQAINIVFDYTYDSNGFFDDPLRRDALQRAGQFYEDNLLDDLDAIEAGPSGEGYPNTWSATFANPGTGEVQTELDLVVPADTLIIYAGGRDLPGSELALGGPGGYDGSGDDAWLETVRARGESNAYGPTATDFGPWGGAITFDTHTGGSAAPAPPSTPITIVPYVPIGGTTGSTGGGYTTVSGTTHSTTDAPFASEFPDATEGEMRDWNFNVDLGPLPWQHDFYSVAVHELAHVLGFGTSDSWSFHTDAVNGQFGGPASVDEYGAPVELHTDLSHWASDLTSGAYPRGGSHEALMSPDIMLGEQRGMTNVDMAAMVDVGWELVVPPETRVVDRHLFYNNSRFDGGSIFATEADDAAIAANKSALLPGEQATFENYGNYSRGINGVMIDVEHLLEPDQLGLADFRFRVGNGNDLDAWQTAPDPFIVEVRETGDTEHRISLVWLDNRIENEWLEVTLLASDFTGLEQDDVFYFGNAVGETGDSGRHALVGAADIIAVREHSRGPANRAGVDDPFDFNRDGLVDAGDMAIVRNNITSPFNSFRLISTSAPLAPPPLAEGNFSAVPEPSAWMLAVLGLIGLAWRRREA